MYALVDCNNFFVSAERVFRPDLSQKPVCVLSNNDGCVVSLSNEAKKIGIKRGDPLFKIKNIVDNHHVAIFSSNYILYAGMSARVMQILKASVKEIDIYSIDEAFLNLSGYPENNLEEKMRQLSHQIQKWTGIPVSIGVAQTKTLAKVAAHYAKKYAGYRGVCLINNEEKRVKALSGISIGNIWGIGRESVKKMEYYSIHNAYDFSLKNAGWVQRNFTISGLRTWKELNGISCIETTEIIDKQSICTSRSFGKTVKDIESLRESIATFTASSAQKLRKQHSTANILSIFIATDRFANPENKYYNHKSIQLPVPTADTAELIVYAQQLLLMIFRTGYAYKKSGVILSGIIPNTGIQQNIFDTITNRERRNKLNTVIDAINIKNGLNTVKYAIQESADKKWISNNEFQSRNYLTNIKELLEVK